MAPYYVFAMAGFDVTVASVKGGQIPVDDGSLQGKVSQDLLHLGGEIHLLQFVSCFVQVTSKQLM